jgi:hypothetical protein
MLRIDDRDPTPMQQLEDRPEYRPIHERLRLYAVSGTKCTPLWAWRGILFEHNKRRKPRRAHGQHGDGK